MAPLHAWLPDAHAEGPTPISAVLSGLLLNVALYALLRFKMLLALNPAALAPGPLMVTMGLVSLVFAAFMLYRRRDIKRMFAYSSIEHMGIITFAFGMGGPLANFAGLLHMTMHSLTKSAIFFAVGHIAQVKGTQRIADMGGLTETNPVLGWGLVLGVVAIAGLPPLGIFMSEFLVVTSTFARAPWLAIVLVFGILVGVAALFLRLNTIAFGEPRGPTAEAKASYVPMFAHLALVFVAGIYLPPALVTWFQNVAKLLGIEADGADGHDRGRLGARPRRMSARGGARGRLALRDQATGRPAIGRCSACGATQAPCTWRVLADERARDRGHQHRMSGRTLPVGRGAACAGYPPGAHDPRSLRHRAGGLARYPALARSGVLGRADPLGERGAAPPTRAPYAFLPAEGEEPAPDPGRPGPCRHHRARAFPFHRQRRDRGAAGTAPRLRAQGNRGADGGRKPRPGRATGRPHVSGDSTVAYALAFAHAVEAALEIEVPPRAVYLRALMAELERLANHFGDIGADLQ